MAVIFIKTTKGQDEILRRSGELTPRIRRLLILIDGKRSIDELHNVFPADDLTHSLGLLEEMELIEIVQTNGQAVSSGLSGNSQRLPSITAFRALSENDPTDLAKARNFMENTINAFVGAVGTSSLLTSIQDATSHTELRALFDDWYHAIVATRDGRREAESLRSKLLEVI
ncbi:MAG: hypothetical protein WCL27_13865 [Betaproteobacteria bacterium]